MKTSQEKRSIKD